MAGLGGLLLGWLGAAGSYELPIFLRLALWIGLCLIAAIFAYLIEAGLSRAMLRNRAPLSWWFLLSLGLAVAMVPIIFLLNSAGGVAPIEMLPTFLGNSLIISAALTASRMAIGEIMSIRANSGRKMPDKPSILKKLNPGLHDAKLKALKSEGHYVQVFTDKGNELLLMRFRDAIAETDECEGMQVHRCWWVSRSAITEMIHKDGRLELEIGEDIRVPVSRSYRAAWRRVGW